jgi:hypothetical protein
MFSIKNATLWKTEVKQVSYFILNGQNHLISQYVDYG